MAQEGRDITALNIKHPLKRSKGDGYTKGAVFQRCLNCYYVLSESLLDFLMVRE